MMGKQKKCDVASQPSLSESHKPSSFRVMVHFNIGGKHFQILRATLNHIPDSQLSRLSETDVSYDAEKRKLNQSKIV